MKMQVKLPILRKQLLYFENAIRRNYSTEHGAIPHKFLNRMDAWQIHEYCSEAQLTNTRTPIINSPCDVLIKVEAASVNPLDVAMSNGYGSEMIGLLRKIRTGSELPLTLGRDFSGKVISKGLSSCKSKNLQVGQQVWGVVPVHLQGSHAETVLVPNTVVAPQPSNLNPVEATSLMYAGVTAWSALWLFGGLLFRSIQGRRTLVLGASGGVGSIAVQLLKAENAVVFASCSTDAIPFVQTLGADVVYNYNDPDYVEIVKSNGPYDIILDAAGLGVEYYTKNNLNCNAYVTLTHPFLKNGDQYGLFGGLLSSATQFVLPNFKAFSQGSTIRWALFTPLPQAIEHIGKLVSNGKLIPAVSEVYGFNELQKAYERVGSGHLRGKVVIDMLKQGDGLTTKGEGESNTKEEGQSHKQGN